MENLNSEQFLKEIEKITGDKATNEQKIRGVITDLKLLLNEDYTRRTLKEDLADICRDLEDLQTRIDSELNKEVFEEDKISLDWALDLVDYLYKIIKILDMEN